MEQQEQITNHIQFGSIVFRDNFDSGNLGEVIMLNQQAFRVTPRLDCQTAGIAKTTRSWFYFGVSGLEEGCKVTFYISKVNALWSVASNNSFPSKQNIYKPVFKQGSYGQWQRIPSNARVYITRNNQIEVSFEFMFEKGQCFFAFSYPYQYSRCLEYMNQVKNHATKNNTRLYAHLETLIKTTQGRDVQLFTLSSNDGKLPDIQPTMLQLFPQDNRPFKFRANKPVVLITARVHPGETPSSYALEGMLNFLLSEDLRAVLLLRYFVFLVVPMLNPDGVYNGNYRMDMLHQNLNRHYKSPSNVEQPSIFGVKSIVEHLAKSNRLAFYFDLHAHPGKKGCFMYGNAFDDFVDQVESQVFTKLVSMHSHFFEHQQCNFTLKHMSHKDRSDQLTKEGCGRVVVYKTARIIHSYTLECGYHSPGPISDLPDNTCQQFKVNHRGFLPNALQDNSNGLFNNTLFFTDEMYRSVGRSLLQAILQTFDKNPYSRVPNSHYKSVYNLRRLTAFEVFHQAERFRMFELHLYAKVKRINELVEEYYDRKYFDKKVFDLKTDCELGKVDWPSHMGYRKGVESFKKQVSNQFPNRRSHLSEHQMREELNNETQQYFMSSKIKVVEEDVEQDDSDVDDEKMATLRKKIEFNKILDIYIENDSRISDNSIQQKIDKWKDRSPQRRELPSIECRKDKYNRSKWEHMNFSQLSSPVRRSMNSSRKISCSSSKHRQEVQREQVKLKLFTNMKLPAISKQKPLQILPVRVNKKKFVYKKK